MTITLVWTQNVNGREEELHRQPYAATLKDGNEAEVFDQDGIFLMKRPMEV